MSDNSSGVVPLLFWVIVKAGRPLAIFPMEEDREAYKYAVSREARRMLGGVLGEFATPLEFAKEMP